MTAEHKVKAGPAALLHYEKTGRRLNHLQLAAINEAVVTEEQMALWAKAIEAWMMRGYNPGNIEGQLSWYKNGVPQNGKPKGNPSRETDYNRLRIVRNEGPWGRQNDRL